MERRDERQLRGLAIAHYVYAAFVAFGALYVLFFVLAGFGVLGQPDEVAARSMPHEVGWVLIIVGLLFAGLLGGLCFATVVAGQRLERRTHRSYCMVIAAVNALLSVPIGTVLGIVTIVTLMRPGVAESFES